MWGTCRGILPWSGYHDSCHLFVIPERSLVRSMHFDPAIAAQQALHRAKEQGQLGSLEHTIVEAEESFSSNAGPEAKRGYELLQQLGDELPEVRAFQEFLIYITWQQATEETIPQHFHQGVKLCDRFLGRFGNELEGSATLKQVVDIRNSFRGGVGDIDDPTPEYDEDAFKGGD